VRPALVRAAAALSAVLLAGCSGLVVMAPAAWTDAIPASLAALSGKPDGSYRGSYTIALPAGAYAAFRHVEVDVSVASGSITASACGSTSGNPMRRSRPGAHSRSGSRRVA